MESGTLDVWDQKTFFGPDFRWIVQVVLVAGGGLIFDPPRG